jgi:hypothetical protein
MGIVPSAVCVGKFCLGAGDILGCIGFAGVLIEIGGVVGGMNWGGRLFHDGRGGGLFELPVACFSYQWISSLISRRRVRTFKVAKSLGRSRGVIESLIYSFKPR